ncbi:hypothetical protein PoB_004081400 [Plakobranchus ocellatus]|uniref:Nuclear protein MDM1 n=1 Tax=Plakobranchus ocellatus TaxID=259542 RepID=A0AAV4B7H7_9GAST|nr:hypothetical protein PoB_004081400 [Plakobranchus ocellatus]
MPRLLSSYAANKRVEDGLKRKQEQIRQEYVRARHRYLDETEKLIKDLVQIHVKTPSAFRRGTPPNSAPSFSRQGRGGVFPYPSQGVQLPHHLTSQQQQQTTAEILHETSQALGCRSSGDRNTPGMPALDGEQHGRVPAGGSRSAPIRRAAQGVAAPATTGVVTPQPPVVQIRGDEVFYQYDTGRPSGWKKIEPAYRTKVLLHRNKTVSQALHKQQQNLGKDSSGDTTDSATEAALRHDSGSTSRKNSVYSTGTRRDLELYGRRESLFSRRSSRRASRLFEDTQDDFDEEDRVSRLSTLMQQQLSPGHTPRMLDGWTIMNWCLWNKRTEKPIWATKRYIEKKRREFKKYEASRTRERKELDLPAKPLSASERSRENRRNSSVTEKEPVVEPRRAKSVPLNTRDSSRLEGVDEEDEQEEEEEEEKEETGTETLPRIPDALDRGILRPTTSILRSSRLDEGQSQTERDDVPRPKTTHPRRRVTLGEFIQQDSLLSSNSNKNADEGNNYINGENKACNDNDETLPSQGSAQVGEQPEGQRKRTISINEYPQVVNSSHQGPQTPRSSDSSLVLTRAQGERADLEDRMPGLAATRLATRQADGNGSRKPVTPRKAPGVSKKVNTVGTVVFPKVKHIVPELGTDSPR